MFNNSKKINLKDNSNSHQINNFEEATFGMGCFWCSEDAFYAGDTKTEANGIISTSVGYCGLSEKQEIYKDKLKNSNLIEAVRILFNPTKITYKEILNIFWYNIDPFDNQGQFCDRGNLYIATIFYKNNTQLEEAKKSKEEKERLLGKKILTNIQPVLPFTLGNEDDQKYKINNPVKYQYYRFNCGRDRKLQEIWGRIKIQQKSFVFNKKLEFSTVLEEA